MIKVQFSPLELRKQCEKCTSEKMISFMKFDTKDKIFAHSCKKSKDSGMIENWNSHTIYTLIHNIHIPFRAFGVSSYTQSSKNSPQLIFHMLDMPLNGIKLEKNAFSLVLRSLTLHEKQTSQMSRQSQGWRKVWNIEGANDFSMWHLPSIQKYWGC